VYNHPAMVDRKKTRGHLSGRGAWLLWLILLLLFSALGCSRQRQTVAATTPQSGEPTSISVTSEATAVPATPTPTLPPPSPTPQLAALVNGQPILLESFQRELKRYELAQEELGLLPGVDGEDYQRVVLDALIEKELLRQAAYAGGTEVTPQMVDDRVVQLRLAASEHGGFDPWLAANKWTLEEFRLALADEMLAETMVARITADVPYTGEQVRARYIQVDDLALAESLLAQINEGADFADLAARYSRDVVTGPAGGDLGFFARGALLVPEVEEAAFSLQPEQNSPVIAVKDEATGQTIYYLLQVTERDLQRPLSTDLRFKLLQEAYDSWLADQFSAATIVPLLEE